MSALEKSADWRRRWRQHIGGGRSAAAAGIHEYMTPLDLYLSMIEDQPIDIEMNPNMLRGILLEHVAMQRLQMLHPDLQFVPHDQDNFLMNPAYPWASDLPDGWVSHSEDGSPVEIIPVQIKVPTPENFAKLSERLPNYIRANCVHSVAVQRSQSILLACMNPVTMEIDQRIITPSAQEIGLLMRAEEKFWRDHLIPRIPPAPQSKADVKRLWPAQKPGSTIEATMDIAGKHAILWLAKQDHKRYEKQIDELTLILQSFMKDAETLVCEGIKLATWKGQDPRVFDEERFKRENPKLAAEYMTTRHSRVFLPKRP